MENNNILIEVEYKNNKIEEITMYKLHDVNERTTYTKSKRGLNKALEEIKASFNDDTKYNDILNIFEKYNIRYHSYCALD